MLKFSANSSSQHYNFVVQNVSPERSHHPYIPIVCILKNLLQRGYPTHPSTYLKQQLPDYQLDEKFPLIASEVPVWNWTIKGDRTTGNNPAQEFFTSLPQLLPEIPFLQQLILPEVKISEIVDIEDKRFIHQQVDFYLPQAKLVIEIDGTHHLDPLQRDKDRARDVYLAKEHVKVIRIPTHLLQQQDHQFQLAIQEIRKRCGEYESQLSMYASSYLRNLPMTDAIKATAVMRWQLLILSMIECGRLSISEDSWNFQVMDAEETQVCELAIQDLFRWMKHLCKLAKLPFSEPQITIRYTDAFTDDGSIKVNFSLQKRWTDEHLASPDVIFVRTDYWDDRDYFQMSVAERIDYTIIPEGEEESNTSSLLFLLENIFGFSTFNVGQLPIIENALRGRDTIGLLPTGGGKSLCFQLVALLQPCVSFVVVPIKALMVDQVENLHRRGITRVQMISSDQTGEERDKIAQEYARGKYFFIFISPERFQIARFREYLQELNQKQTVAFAIIDEVHCLSEWGHDFRTSYLHLCRTVRKYFPQIRFLGLTATASLNVLNDIIVEFGISKEDVRTPRDYTRPELRFLVINRGRSQNQELYGLLDQFMDRGNVFDLRGESTRSGLIFTTHVNGDYGCFPIAGELARRYQVPIEWYSGNKPKKSGFQSEEEFNQYKQEAQNKFKNNQTPLLVATKAFGMGIDKSNIRYTIHYGIPGSLESLYQEAGRAGRDKQKALCYILYAKENKDQPYFDKLFDLHTTTEEIGKMIDRTDRNDQRDILRNFFLWTGNNKGVDAETELAMHLFREYAQPGTKRIIKCHEVATHYANRKREILGEDTSGAVEKAIYRLSLLGIVDDWVIEYAGNKSFDVEFRDFNEEVILSSLLRYIGKYDAEFTLTDRQKEKYATYFRIMDTEDCEFVEKMVRLLVQWTYDNVFYHRRQSLKTLVDLCDHFSDADEFKERIESYFRFTDASYQLDHIVQHPEQYQQWLYLLVDEESFINREKLLEVRASLTRFLETYRFNTGLNFLSGMVRLLTGGYEDGDGKGRLWSAFESIRSYDRAEREEILNVLLRSGKKLEEGQKDYLGEVLSHFYPDQVVEIYSHLEDHHSLLMMLSGSVERLERVSDKLYG